MNIACALSKAFSPIITSAWYNPIANHAPLSNNNPLANAFEYTFFLNEPVIGIFVFSIDNKKPPNAIIQNSSKYKFSIDKIVIASFVGIVVKAIVIMNIDFIKNKIAVR